MKRHTERRIQTVLALIPLGLLCVFIGRWTILYNLHRGDRSFCPVCSEKVEAEQKKPLPTYRE
jgi:hypothetical protein